MKPILYSLIVVFGLIGPSSAENLFSPVPKSSTDLLKQVAKMTCTCGGKKYSGDAPACTAPKKPTCVCHEAGKAPTIECK